MTYHLKYRLKAEPGTYTRDDALKREESEGYTDALIVHSILHPADGSLSVSSWSVDGRTGAELDDTELFKVWSLLTSQLAASKTLDEGRKDFAEKVWGGIKAAVAAGRAAEETKVN